VIVEVSRFGYDAQRQKRRFENGMIEEQWLFCGVDDEWHCRASRDRIISARPSHSNSGLLKDKADSEIVPVRKGHGHGSSREAAAP
nr:hypothetical protein [Tanacetum cinerariifolium]